MGDRQNYWQKEEMDILQANYRRLKISAIQELLPGRTAKAIKNKANRLLLRVPRPRKEDWEQLFEMYPDRCYKFYCIAMVCSPATVRYWKGKIADSRKLKAESTKLKE